MVQNIAFKSIIIVYQTRKRKQVTLLFTQKSSSIQKASKLMKIQE